MAKKKNKEKQEKQAERDAAIKAAAEAAAAQAAAEAAAEAARIAYEIANPPRLPLKKGHAKKAAKKLVEARRAGELEPKKKRPLPEAVEEKPVAPAVPLPDRTAKPLPKTFAARLLLGNAAKATLPESERVASRGNRPLG